jgi:chaperonin cofactor prefoldin
MYYNVWSVYNNGTLTFCDAYYENFGLRPMMQISISALASVDSADALTRDTTILELQADIAQLKVDRTTMQNNIENLQTQLNNAKSDLESKITAAQNAATAAAKAAMDAEIEILNGTIAGLESQISELNAELLELKDYIELHAGDYKYGYGNGFTDGMNTYLKEYAFVTWNVLTDSIAAGELTTYVLHDKVESPYGTEITEPAAPAAAVRSKQYVYTFVGWSLTRQTGALPNLPLVTFPKTRTATDIIYYAQYTRTEREYTVKWVTPVITDGQLNYTDGTVTTKTYKYGDAITSLTFTEINDAGVNYIPNGWSATQGGAKITDFGKCMGERTFYARYAAQPTV